MHAYEIIGWNEDPDRMIRSLGSLFFKGRQKVMPLCSLLTSKVFWLIIVMLCLGQTELLARNQESSAGKRLLSPSMKPKRLSGPHASDGGTSAQGKKRIRTYWDTVEVTYLMSPAEIRARLPADVPRFGMQIMLGHCGAINDLTFSPDGRLLASASWDGTAKLWDMATGCELKSFLHEAPVKAVAFSPDGQRLVTGSLDSVISMWDIRSGVRLRRDEVNIFSMGGNMLGLEALAVSQDGRRVAVTFHDEIKFWDYGAANYIRYEIQDDLSSGSISPIVPFRFKAHEDLVKTLAFSPDGQTLASGSWDKTIKLWDTVIPRKVRVTRREARTGKKIWEKVRLRQIRTLRGHTFWINSVAFSPDGRLLASASRDKTLRIWDVTTGDEVVRVTGREFEFPKHGDERFVSVLFSPDGRHVAAGDTNGTVRLIDVDTGNEAKRIEGASLFENVDSREKGSPHKSGVTSLAFSPDGSLLASGSEHATVKIWHLPSDSQVYTFANKLLAPSGAVFRPDGYLLALYGRKGEPTLWDTSVGRPVRTFGLPRSWPSPEVIAANGMQVVLSSGDKQVRIWDLENQRETRVLPLRVNLLEHVELSADGRFLAGAFREPNRGATGDPNGVDYKVTVWEVRTGGKVASFDVRIASGFMPAPLMTFSHDSRYFACAWRKNMVGLWDWGRRREVQPIGANDLTVWDSDANTWVPFRGVAELREDQSVRDAYHNTYEAIRGTSVVVWDIQGKEEASRFAVMERMPGDLAFGSHGVLAVAGVHGTTVWKTGTWQEICYLSEARAPVAISLDGVTLASSYGDRRMALWKLSEGKQIAILRCDDTSQEPAAFSPDGRVLVAMGEDRSLKLWDVASGRMLGTLAKGKYGEWIAFLPNGYYQCTPDFLANIAVILDERAYPIEQFDLILNRPDIVMARLGCAHAGLIRRAKGIHKERLQRMGISEEHLGVGRSLPHVEVQRRSVPFVTEAKQIFIDVKASDEEHLLQGIRAWVNGVPLSFDGEAVFSVPNRPSHKMEAKVPITLCLGINTIQLCALNEKGVQSPMSTVRVKRVSESEESSLWLLAIGVSRYRESGYDLQFPAKDADDLAALVTESPLSDDFRKRFAAIHIAKLKNEQATREKILGAKEFLEGSRVDDTVIVFAAGHGFLTPDNGYYFGTHDTNPESPANRGLAFDELHSLLGGIPARQKLLLLDTCHSGEIEGNQTRHEPEPVVLIRANQLGLPRGSVVKIRRAFPKRGIKGTRMFRKKITSPSPAGLGEAILFADLRRDTGASIIVSCSGEEYSVEGPRWENGVFAYSILECLGTGIGDADRDGAIRVSELHNYVVRRVRELTAGRQSPTERRQNPLNDFAVLELRPSVIEVGPMDQPLVHTCAAALSPTGKLLLTSHTPGIAKLWDVRQRRLIRTLRGKWGMVGSTVGFSSDGSLAMTLGPEGVVRLWDILTGRVVKSFENCSRNLRYLALSPDYRKIMTVRDDGILTVCDVTTGRELSSFKTEKPAFFAFLSPQGDTALITGKDWGILWDMKTGTVAGNYDSGLVRGHAVLSPDGTYLLVEGQNQVSLCLLDAKSEQLVKVLKDQGTGFLSWAFSPNGRRILTGGRDGTVRLWETETGTLLRRFTGHKEMVLYVAFMPSGEQCLSVSGDNTARVWHMSGCSSHSLGSQPSVEGFLPKRSPRR